MLRSRWLAASVFLVVGALWSQTTSATLSGTVTDSSQAVVPGAKITARETRTGVSFTTESNQAGVYHFPSLPPGRYRLEAELAGFQKLVYNDVVLEVGARQRQNFQLEPGALATVVEVAATNENLISTVSSSVGNVVTLSKVTGLPIVSRNALDFVYLQAGVVGDNFSGTRIGALNITLDGINVQDNRINSGVFSTSTTSTDIVDEFRVITAPADAEYGRGTGQIQSRTRSGTNEFHGSLFELHRNTVLNANTWFNNQRGRDRDGNLISPRNRLVVNNYGGRLGGPVVRNKLFFHANYEGYRSATRSALTGTVLTDPARHGLYRFFPAVRNGNANAAVPTVDLEGNPVRPAAATGELQTVNLLQYDPARARLDPTGVTAKFLGYLPLPNNFRSGDGLNTAGYTWSRSALYVSNLYRLKLDYYLSQKTRLDWSWQREASSQSNGFMAQPFPTSPGGDYRDRTKFLSLGADTTLSPRLLNQFRGGFNRPWVRFSAPWEVHGREVMPAQGEQIFLPLFSSFTTGIADQDPQGRISPIYQYADTLSYTFGKHTLKGGAEVRWVSSNGFSSFTVVPRASIGGGVLSSAPITGIPLIGQNSGTAVAILNDLTGTLSSKSQAFNATGGASPQFVPGEPRQRTWRQRELSWFFKDDWRLSPSLTVNLGLRWEYYGVPYEALGRMAALKGGSGRIFGLSGNDFSALFRPGVMPGALAEVELLGRNSPNPGREILPRDRNNFCPAVGVAWKLPWIKRDTLLRAGYSIGYERNSIRNLDVYAADVPGLRITNVYRSSQALNFANMPRLEPPGPPLTPVPLTDRAVSMFAWDSGLRTPYVQNFNASLTHRLSGHMSLELRYVGTKGTGLLRGANINEANIFENGILEAFLAAQAGRGHPLLDRAFGGLSISGVGVVDGSAGRTGADAARALMPTTFANNNASSLATYLNSNTLAGSPGQLLRRAGLPENFVMASPQFGAAYYLGNLSNSTYQALQVEVIRQLSRGLEFQVNWTWSRTLGDEEGAGQDLVNSYQTNRDRGLDKRLLGFHRTHVVRSNWIWQLPFGRGQRWLSGAGALLERLAGGWEAGVIFNLFTGVPLSFYSGTASFNNFSGDNTANALASIRPGGYKVTVKGDGVRYFEGWTIVPDPGREGLTTLQNIRASSTLFAIQDSSGALILQNPRPGTMGNLSTTLFYGPGSFRFDLRFGKRVRLRERQDLQFYFDAQNATNSPQWGSPNTSINSTTFGRITSASGNRILAVTARYNF